MRFSRWTRALYALTAVGGLAWLCTRPAPVARAGPTAAASSAATPDTEKTEPGLSLTFESIGQPSMSDSRSSRLIALYVPEKTPPSPFLHPGPFKATWEGEINVALRSDVIFSAAGSGKVTVKIADKVVFEANGDALDPNAVGTSSTRLKKGKNPITVIYESPAKGDAFVRLYWSSPGEFLPEPINPAVLAHGTAASTVAKPLALATQVRQGREWFAELRCVRCHTAEIKPETAMPELSIDAPSLEGIGSRLNEAWMAEWVADPHALRPDTSMPRLASSTYARDIAAYLASLGGKPEEDATPEPAAADVQAGGKLIASLGCIGCHTLPNAPGTPETNSPRVPWSNVRAKFKPAGLIAFLKQPEAHFQWIRMPNFHLDDTEAKQIAAYLIAGGQPMHLSGHGDAVKGKDILLTSGCLQCHTLGPKSPAANSILEPPALAAIPKDNWSRGCMADNVAQRGQAPDFSMTRDQRAALLAFAATDRASLQQDTLPEFAERQIASLRCIACHNRDEKSDLWDELAKETAQLGGVDAGNVETDPNIKSKIPGEPVPGSGDQTRPILTWTGEKLRPEWSEQFIAGKLPYKPRMWLTARMPSFPARAHGLAYGMSLEHGFTPSVPAQKQTDAEAAEIGKKLSSREGGLSCIQCHGIGSTPPVAPFEAPSINFRHIGDRLRKDYYDRWMRNPQRIVPTSKMPAFANLEDGKLKSALGDVLEGDAQKQFDALWQYILAGDKVIPPEEAPQ